MEQQLSVTGPGDVSIDEACVTIEGLLAAEERTGRREEAQSSSRPRVKSQTLAELASILLSSETPAAVLKDIATQLFGPCPGQFYFRAIRRELLAALESPRPEFKAARGVITDCLRRLDTLESTSRSEEPTTLETKAEIAPSTEQVGHLPRAVRASGAELLVCVETAKQEALLVELTSRLLQVEACLAQLPGSLLIERLRTTLPGTQNALRLMKQPEPERTGALSARCQRLVSELLVKLTTSAG